VHLRSAGAGAQLALCNQLPAVAKCDTFTMLVRAMNGDDWLAIFRRHQQAARSLMEHSKDILSELCSARAFLTSLLAG